MPIIEQVRRKKMMSDDKNEDREREREMPSISRFLSDDNNELAVYRILSIFDFVIFMYFFLLSYNQTAICIDQLTVNRLK